MIGTLKSATMQLGMIRLFLTEALKTGEVLHNDGDRAMIRQIAYQLLGIENSLNGVLYEIEAGQPEPVDPPIPPPITPPPSEPTDEPRTDTSTSGPVPLDMTFPNA